MTKPHVQRPVAVPTDWERMTDLEKDEWLEARVRATSNRIVYYSPDSWLDRDDDTRDDGWEDG